MNLSMVRTKWMYPGVPVLVAGPTVVSLATSPSVASAATASAYEAGASLRGPAQGNDDGAGAGRATLACEAIADAMHPALPRLMCRAFSLIPTGAQATIMSVIEAHADKVAPGWACRRHLDGDSGEPLPGCERYFDDDGSGDPSGLCGRFAASGDVHEHPLLARRCHRAIGADGGGPRNLRPQSGNQRPDRGSSGGGRPDDGLPGRGPGTAR